MRPARQLIIAKTAIALGCLWLVLVLFKTPPLFLLLFMLMAWLRPPAGIDEILTVVNGTEYIAALATVALGTIVWRRSVIGKWPSKLIVGALVVFIVGIGTRYELKEQARIKRENVYWLEGCL